MAVSYISSASAAANSVTMPTHQAGDLIVAFAYRDGSTTAPALPAGWTNINNSGGNTNSARLAYRNADSASETSGTWTNATGLVVHVYRGANVGASAVGGASSNSISYPALTLQKTDNTSWVARFAGHRTATDLTTNIPGGYTARTGIATENRGIDTDGSVSSNPTAATQAVNATSGYRAYTLEIRAREKTSIWTEDFTTQDAVNWSYTAGSATGGQYEVAPNSSYNGTNTFRIYDFVGSSIAIEFVQPPNVGNGTTSAWFGLFGNPDNTDKVDMYWENDNLRFRETVNGVANTTSITYNGTDHRWWRIRESSGAIYWETSPNGSTWTVQRIKTAVNSLSSVRLTIYAGFYGTEPSPGTAIFDNFNLLPNQETESLIDTFATADTSKWTFNASASVSSGQLELPSVSDYSNAAISNANYNLTDSYVKAELIQPTNVGNGTSGTSLYVGYDTSGDDMLQILIEAQTNILCIESVGGTGTSTSIPYDPDNHRWFRIREASGTVYWEVSSDGASWYVLRSKAPGITITNLKVVLVAGFYGTEPSPGTGIWDNVNVHAKTSVLIDDFTLEDTSRWSGYGGSSSTDSGQLLIVPGTNYLGVYSNEFFDFTASSIYAEFVQPPNVGNGTTAAELYIVSSDGSLTEEIIWSNGNLIFREKIVGVTNDTSILYNSLDHRWIRIRESAGTVYWETSQNGSTWTVQRSKTVDPGIDFSSVRVAMLAGYYGVEPSPGTAIFDNLNLANPTIDIIGVSQVSVAPGVTTFTCPTPAGTVDDDVMLATLMNDWGAHTALSAAGWTQIESVNEVTDAVHLKVFAKVASSEGANQTFGTVSPADSTAGIVTLRGVDASFGSWFSADASLSQAAPSLSSSGSILVTIIGASGPNATVSWMPPAGMFEATDTSNGYASHSIAYQYFPSNPTGAKAFSTLDYVDRGPYAVSLLVPAMITSSGSGQFFVLFD